MQPILVNVTTAICPARPTRHGRSTRRKGGWLAVGALALSAYSAACASTGAVPRPFPVPGGTTARRAPATPAAPGSAPAAPSAPAPGAITAPHASTHGIDGYALTGTALALRGAPYRNGGGDPSGFDCSGFTKDGVAA